MNWWLTVREVIGEWLEHLVETMATYFQSIFSQKFQLNSHCIRYPCILGYTPFHLNVWGQLLPSLIKFWDEMFSLAAQGISSRSSIAEKWSRFVPRPECHNNATGHSSPSVHIMQSLDYPLLNVSPYRYIDKLVVITIINCNQITD